MRIFPTALIATTLIAATSSSSGVALAKSKDSDRDRDGIPKKCREGLGFCDLDCWDARDMKLKLESMKANDVDPQKARENLVEDKNVESPTDAQIEAERLEVASEASKRGQGFEFGDFSLIGSNVGRSSEGAMCTVARARTKAGPEEGYCTFFFNAPEKDDEKDAPSGNRLETFAMKTYNWIPMPNPNKVGKYDKKTGVSEIETNDLMLERWWPKNGASPEVLAERERMTRISEEKNVVDWYTRALGDSFLTLPPDPRPDGDRRGKMSFLECAERFGYVNLGCTGMHHRGPSVMGMVIAAAGCSPKQTFDIVHKYWGDDKNEDKDPDADFKVRHSTRLAMYTAAKKIGEERGEKYVTEMRERLAKVLRGDAKPKKERDLDPNRLVFDGIGQNACTSTVKPKNVISSRDLAKRQRHPAAGELPTDHSDSGFGN